MITQFYWNITHLRFLHISGIIRHFLIICKSIFANWILTRVFWRGTQPAFTCPKSTMESKNNVLNLFQISSKGTRNIIYVALVPVLLTFNRCHTLLCCLNCWLEQASSDWENSPLKSIKPIKNTQFPASCHWSLCIPPENIRKPLM